MARSAVTAGRLRKIGAEIGIDGIEEIQANIAKTLTRASGEQFKREVCMPAAMILVTNARRNARVRTGRLRSAIFAAYGDQKKPNVIVGVNYKTAPHAHLEEYSLHGHPYMRPAITESRSPMAASLAKSMRKLIGGPDTGPRGITSQFSIGGEFL